MLRILYRNQHK